MNVSDLHGLKSLLIVVVRAILSLILRLRTNQSIRISINFTYIDFGTLARAAIFSLYAASNLDLTL